MKKTIFTGSATAIITPFTGNAKEVDYPAFDRLIRYQIHNNTDALIIAGTTGESPVLTKEEKIRLIKIANSLTDKKIPVIAGTGSNNTEETVRKSNDAEKEGVDGLLIVTPFYNKCSQEGIIKHYNYIADRVSAPVIIYNVPSRTGVDIKPETYKALSEHKNINSVKDASGSITNAVETHSICKDDLHIYCGNDSETTAFMAVGAKGVISVASNIIPGQMHDIVKLCIENKYDDARNIMDIYAELIKAMFYDINPIPVKYACSRIFGTENSLRLPLTELSEENKKKLDIILKMI